MEMDGSGTSKARPSFSPMAITVICMHEVIKGKTLEAKWLSIKIHVVCSAHHFLFMGHILACRCVASAN